MRIELTSTNFGIKAYHTTRYDNLMQKRIIDTIYLQNGNTVKITKKFDKDNLVEKVYQLKNNIGDFIKTKIKKYKGNKLIQTINDNIKE